jgi:hypothetical protein
MELEDAIKVIVDSVEYRIHSENICINVKVHANGRMTITPKHCGSEFKFMNSDPKLIRTIAMLLFKASELPKDIPDLT